MSQPIEDDNITGTSEPAVPLDDVSEVRGDAGARDLVGAAEDDSRALVDGVYGDDEPVDPAYEAVIEAGGGVAEGFEQAEALLVEHATDSEGSTRDILFDEIEELEDDVDEDVYGEADDIVGDFGRGDDDY